MADLRLESLSKRFGARRVIDDLDLAVQDGEFFAVLGPSGCGKTTLLRLVAGFMAPDAGRIKFGQRDVTALPPEARDAAMVFQSYALFPHLDLARNVAFGLEARNFPRADRDAKVAQALTLVGLSGRDREAVGNLSGGEQQRVALARALVVEPPLLLLDEPMSNLDQKLREGTRTELRALQRRLGITALYVTHDQHDALEMADRVAVIAGGRICQVGTPRELYDRPATEFVATFLGQANLFDGEVLGHDGDLTTLRLGAATVRVARQLASAGAAVRVAIRPESLAAMSAAGDLEEIGEGEVRAVGLRGATVAVEVALPSGPELRVLLLNTAGVAASVRPGDRLRVGAPRDRIVVVAASPPL